jgi:DNA-binding NarL/FixJ family response regulator
MISNEPLKNDNLTLRIAIADDHQIVREGLIGILNSIGHEVVADAEEGEALIAAIEALEAAPDVCLIDIKMKGMNGVQTTREIKRRWKDTHVLALTSFDDEMMVINMICAGAQGYLLKRQGKEKLREAIQSVYSRGLYFNEQMNSRLYHAVHNKEIKPVQLSELERSVLTHCCSGQNYELIAKKLNTTRRSVESTRDRLFEKFGVHGRVSLVLIALRLGFVPMECLYDVFNDLK